MNSKEFRRRQRALGWTNKKIADFVRKSEQTVSNWRNDRQAIPEHVELLLDLAESTQRDEESAMEQGKPPVTVGESLTP